jgi:hypothetical protein
LSISQRANEYYKIRKKIKKYKANSSDSSIQTFSTSPASSSTKNFRVPQKEREGIGFEAIQIELDEQQTANSNKYHSQRKEKRSSFSQKLFGNINGLKKRLSFEFLKKDDVKANVDGFGAENDTANESFETSSDYYTNTYLEPIGKNNSFQSKMIFTMYLVKKLCYIINCLCQFLILNKFIAGETRTNIIFNDNNEFVRSDLTFMTNKRFWKGFEFGYKSLANLIESGNLFGERSRLLIFHTVIFCDFRIRMLGDRLHRHTVQCVVPVNIFTEKMFTVLWFWLLILNFINIFNFIKWLTYYFSSKARIDFILEHLLRSSDCVLRASCLANANQSNQSSTLRKSNLLHGKNQNIESDIGFNSLFKKTKNELNKRLVDNLTHSYLMHDNIFIIKLIAENSNQIITTELVTLLFENFKRKRYIFDENTV